MLIVKLSVVAENADLGTYYAAGNYPQEMKGDYEEMKGIPLGGRGHEYGNFNGESQGRVQLPLEFRT
jgi:hypothetical protein